LPSCLSLFRSRDPATSEVYTLSLHDALPIWIVVVGPLGRLADRWGAERVLLLGCLGYAAMYGLMVLWRDPLATLVLCGLPVFPLDRKSTRLNSSHVKISYAVFCLKKKKNELQ